MYCSASVRISKGQGQGYQVFLRKGREQKKRPICVVQGKTDRLSLLFFRVNKMFSLKF
jgi:hypothetical protein